MNYAEQIEMRIETLETILNCGHMARIKTIAEKGPISKNVDDIFEVMLQAYRDEIAQLKKELETL